MSFPYGKNVILDSYLKKILTAIYLLEKLYEKSRKIKFACQACKN